MSEIKYVSAATGDVCVRTFSNAAINCGIEKGFSSIGGAWTAVARAFGIAGMKITGTLSVARMRGTAPAPESAIREPSEVSRSS